MTVDSFLLSSRVTLFMSFYELWFKRYFFQKSVQVVAHCAGSLVLFASLLSGALEGKVRNVVASQVAAHPIPAPFNSYKSSLRLPGVAHAIGIHGLAVDTDASFFSRVFSGLSRKVGNHLVLPYGERCESPLCHRWVLSIPNSDLECDNSRTYRESKD